MNFLKRNIDNLTKTLIFVFLLFCELSAAQDFTVKTFTTKDGLPHNNIRAITRDSTGFLWIGTWDGLSRFDGHEFKNYYHIPNDSTSLPFFSVYCLEVDRNNDLWIMTDLKALVRYNRVSDNFTVIKNINGIPVDIVHSIDTDDEGTLNIITDGEIIKWDDKSGKTSVYKLLGKTGEKFETDNPFYSSASVFNDELWIISYGALKFIKTAEGIYTFDKEYNLINSDKRIIDFDFRSWFKIYSSVRGEKWIFSNTGLFKLDENAGEFRDYNSPIPRGEFQGKQYYFWGTFNDGIYLYNAANSSNFHIPFQSVHLPMAILPDKGNSLWFSSVTTSGVARGLTSLVFTSDFFDNHLISDADSAAPAIYSVIMDWDRNIWTGIRGYDHIEMFRPDNKPVSLDKLSSDLHDDVMHIRVMVPVKDGIWIGYYRNLLQFYDYKKGRFTNYFPSCNSIRAIVPDGKGKVYIGTTDINMFDPRSGKTETIWKSNHTEGIFRMFLDSDGTIWGAMAGSKILKLNTKTNQGSVISIPPGNSNTEDIIKGENGELWLAFLGEGVCRYNPETGASRYYTTQNGLSNNTTYNLIKDRSGNIWVSTNYGISMINPNNDNVRTFGLADGLKIQEFNSGAKFVSDDGEFFFGGMGGFVRFYPDSLGEENEAGQVQKILLTNLEVAGLKRILPKSLNESDTIILRQGENNFHISFSSTDFINSEKTMFRYKLSKVNPDWIETGIRNRNINYSNLKPGWHTLTIEATDINGIWSLNKSIMIRITPYFFQTWGFMIMAPLSAVILIIYLIFIYIREIRHKEKMKQDELRLQSLQGQMNPHFIFNSLNSINYFISNNDKLSANRYIADFSKLIRSILYNMNNDYITLEKEIESLQDYLKIEYMRFGDKFDYEIAVDPGIDREKYKVSPGLIQPFVENAIWHGVRGLENRKGKIKVVFENQQSKLTCRVEDDGVGRKITEAINSQVSAKKSRGISIVSERIRIINNLQKSNYKIAINDLHPERGETGTKVEIDLPVQY